jgi:hypothetical protein
MIRHRATLPLGYTVEFRWDGDRRRIAVEWSPRPLPPRSNPDVTRQYRLHRGTAPALREAGPNPRAKRGRDGGCGTCGGLRRQETCVI